MNMTHGLTLHSPTIRFNVGLELIDDDIWIIIPIKLGICQYYWNCRCNKFGKAANIMRPYINHNGKF